MNYVKILGKTDSVVREMKRYIPTLKTLHPNFENIISDFMYVLDIIYILRRRRKIFAEICAVIFRNSLFCKLNKIYKICHFVDL